MATVVQLAPTASAADTSEFTVTTPLSVYAVTSTGQITERAKMQLLKKVGTGVYEPFRAPFGKNRKRVSIYLSQQEPTYYLQDAGTYIVRKSATTQLVGVSTDNQT